MCADGLSGVDIGDLHYYFAAMTGRFSRLATVLWTVALAAPLTVLLPSFVDPLQTAAVGIYVQEVPATDCSVTATTDGDYTVQTFDQGSVCSWYIPTGVSQLDVLVVGGGGGGGADGGGGGGGGGVRYDNSVNVTAGTAVSVTVGAGGSGGSWSSGTAATAGDTSQVSWSSKTYTANGGAAGGGWTTTSNAAAGTTSGAGLQGTSGTGGAGPGACYNNTITSGTDGNAGFTSSISGSQTTYAGGGGGGSASQTMPMTWASASTLTRGSHGGGNGAAATFGTVNGATSVFFTSGTNGSRGGGGGAGAACGNEAYNGETLGARTKGGDGGDGVVVLRYLTPSRTLSFSATSYSKTYGDSTFSVVASPSVGAGTVTYSVTGSACTVNTSSGVVTIVGAGSCSISAAVASDGTYLGASTTTPASVTIAQAPLTVTASSHSVTYGDAAPSVTPTYSGFVNDDSASDLSTAPTCTTTYAVTSSAASAPSTSCSGAASDNYTFTYVPGSVTIVKKA